MNNTVKATLLMLGALLVWQNRGKLFSYFTKINQTIPS
jgi:hypothetical protein